MCLNKVLCVLNFLNSFFVELSLLIIIIFFDIIQVKLKENLLVLIRNLEMGKIEGLFKLRVKDALVFLQVLV